MADRRAALEERRRKLEELKRAKDAPPSAASAAAAFVPPPLPAAVPSSLSSVLAAAATVSPTTSASLSSSATSAIEPLLSDLLASGPVIETPALDAAARSKRLNALAQVPDVVHVDLGSKGAKDGKAGLAAKLPAAFLSCEAAIQTEEAEESEASLFPARKEPLDETSAAALLGSVGFSSFLQSAVSVLEEQMGSAGGVDGDGQQGSATRQLQEQQQQRQQELGKTRSRHEEEEDRAASLSVLSRLFQQSVGQSSGSTLDTSSSGGLGPGFSPILTLLEVPATTPFPGSSSSSSGDKKPLMPPPACIFPEGAPVSDVAWSNFAQGTLAVSYTASKARRTAVDQQSQFQNYLKALAASFQDGDGGSDGASSSSSASSSLSPAPLASVLVWNMAAPQYPLAALVLGPVAESVSNLSGGGGLGSDICILRFHPHAPHLLLAGTNAGQLLVWDLRSAASSGPSPAGGSCSFVLPVLQPVICSGFSPGSHVNALSALLVAGTTSTASSSLLLTLSGEGRACQWSGVITSAASASSSSSQLFFEQLFPSSFLEPSSSAKLTYLPDASAAAAAAAALSGGSGNATAGGGVSGARDIPVSCGNFSHADPSRLYIGGQEGALYVLLYGGSANQIQTQARVPAHYACITAVAPHPSREVPLLLTGSFDGTVKLWNTELKEPSLAATFDAASSCSFASDVCWSPLNPAVFASADADGDVRLFHIGKGAANSLADEGAGAAAGGGDASGSDGKPGTSSSAIASLASGAPNTNVSAAFAALAVASGLTARSSADISVPVGFYRLSLASEALTRSKEETERGKQAQQQGQGRRPAAVTRLRFSPDGKFLAAATMNGELHVLSLSPEYCAAPGGGEEAATALAERWARA